MKFIEACKKIEADKNYQPGITHRGLFSLVMNPDGSAKHAPRRSACVIQPSDIIPASEDGASLGKLYQVKIASKSCTEWSEEYPVWNIDDSAVILVKLVNEDEGEYSIHSKENVEKKNFNSPIAHLSIDTFLNGRSLPFIEVQKQTLEIKTNSQMMAQAVREGNSFFSAVQSGNNLVPMPPELLCKIAALTGNKEIIPESEANDIAISNFGRP